MRFRDAIRSAAGFGGRGDRRSRGPAVAILVSVTALTAAVVSASGAVGTGCSAARSAQAAQAPQAVATPAQPTAPAAQSPVTPMQTEQVTPAPVLADPGAVAAAVQSVSPQASTGLLVWDRATGQNIASLGADQPFQSASVVKLLIAIDVLGAGTGLDPTREQRLLRMLRDSGDGEANALWVQQGGAELVTRTARLLGLTAAPPADGQWGYTTLTPLDVLAVYRYLLESPATGPVVLAALRGAPRFAADGFDQHFGIPTALGDRPWAVKQGWGSSSQGVFVHTTGLVGAGDRHVVVLLTRHPRGTGFARASQAVTAGAVALAAQLGPPATG